MVKMTVEQLEDMTFDGSIDLDGTSYEVVEESEWEHDHKHQTKNVIFTDGNKYYQGEIGRSGSDWGDWTYDSQQFGSDSPADIYEVKKQEVVVLKWVVV